LRSDGPYPLLAISGEQGSAKTVLSKLLKALIDPNAAPERALSREERELMIAANNGYVFAFDNLSGLPSWLSDALCRLATGGSFAVRQLYTDGLASRGPKREVCHARQLIEVDTAECAQPMHERVEQGAENAGPLDPELAPKFCLGAPDAAHRSNSSHEIDDEHEQKHLTWPAGAARYRDIRSRVRAAAEAQHPRDHGR
jgi:hypothetical protein